jgi:hypothetical protein
MDIPADCGWPQPSLISSFFVPTVQPLKDPLSHPASLYVVIPYTVGTSIPRYFIPMYTAVRIRDTTDAVHRGI